MAEADEELRKENTGDSDSETETDGEQDEEGDEEGAGGGESDEEGDSSEDDDKPLTRKDLKDILKSNQNQNNASRRVSSKRGEIIKKAPKSDERLERVEKEIQGISLLERKRQFGYDNGLAPNEVDLVFKFDPKPSKKTLEDPFVKGGLDSIRSAAKVKNNLPGSSGRASTHQGKDWKDLKADEKQANFADRRRAILDAKGK